MYLALCVYLALSLLKKRSHVSFTRLREYRCGSQKSRVNPADEMPPIRREVKHEVARAHARLVQPPTRTLPRPAGTTMAQTVRKEQIVVEQQQARRSLCPWSLARSRTQPRGCSLRHSGG